MTAAALYHREAKGGPPLTAEICITHPLHTKRYAKQPLLVVVAEARIGYSNTRRDKLQAISALCQIQWRV